MNVAVLGVRDLTSTGRLFGASRWWRGGGGGGVKGGMLSSMVPADRSHEHLHALRQLLPAFSYDLQYVAWFF